MVYMKEIPALLKNNSRIVLLLICLFYLINGIFYIRAQSITSDENGFYNYAKRLAKGHPERLDPVIDNSKTPIIVLNLIPRAFEQVIHPGTHKTDFSKEDVIRGRYVTLVISVLVIIIVYVWAEQLYGIGAGLFGAFLISMSPNNIALAGLVTTDAYSVLFLLLPFYCMWKMLSEKSFTYFIFFCIAIAVAQLTKPSLFHLYILAPLTLLIYRFVYRPPVRYPHLFKYLAIFIFIQWLVINLGYYFDGSDKMLGDYHFVSRLFLSIQHILPANLLIPLPEQFLKELDLSNYYDQLGGGNYYESSFGKITILGQSSIGGSFWYYYIISFLFKTPITYLILLCWVSFVWFKRSRVKEAGQHVLLLTLPVIYFFIIFSFFYKTQLGIRHMIFIYPFICIICSSVISYDLSVMQKRAMLFLSVYLMVSVFYYWRNYFPYTNELVLNKSRAYRIVGSSNLEFHQGALFAAEFLRQHPNVKMAGSHPGLGDFIIRTDDYMDVWNFHTFDWISSVKPFGQVAFDYLLIHVEPKDLKK
jgi:hypothetical protein